LGQEAGSRKPFATVSSDFQEAEKVGPTSFEVVHLLGRGAFGEVYKAV
jgi:hypothetical protein